MELIFNGKEEAYKECESNCDKILKQINTSSSENKIIIGDNFDALKLLKKDYENKIKMIYIDPPYNTRKSSCIRIKEHTMNGFALCYHALNLLEIY